MRVLIVVRLVHIVLGALWVGVMVFSTFVLTPALAEAGPDAGKVMAALQRRRLLTMMPIIALATVISGGWLVQRVYGGMPGLLASRGGLAFAIGAAAALVAFLLGILGMRPAMVRAAALAPDAPGNREEIERLRARAAAMGRLAAVLLLLAISAMAVGRYL